MKKKFTQNGSSIKRTIKIFTAASLVIVLASFSISKVADDFLKELGISKPDADTKIATSIIGGYINTYGLKNIIKIPLVKRSPLAKDLLNYTKTFVNTERFKKEYALLKANNKPTEYKTETPEQMRGGQIDIYKKSIAETEANLKMADANLKPIFEKVLEESRKQLKEAESPNNKTIANYTRNYEQLRKSNEQMYHQSLQEWEAKYPTNHLLFVKQRLMKFMDETKDIDFNAELTLKNGKQVFVNPEYEKQKGYYWKMAFRSGKEVVLPARIFVQQWIDEIK